MRGLFWRVFAWYLGTTVVVLGLGLVVTMLTDPEFSFKRAVSISPDAIQSQAHAAVGAWKRGGEAALRVNFSGRPRYLFRSDGIELLGRHLPSQITELVTRTLSSSILELEIVAPDTYAAVSVKDGETEYIYARILEPDHRFSFVPHPLPLWSRLALGLFTASLICFLFAQYVTSPLRRLRAVARQFAAGNLDARVGIAKPFDRGDEFTDLARDIDNMATQIQSNVQAQQRLLGDISHELRSPLARLQLALEIARRKAGPGAETALNRIEQEAEKLNSLIGQILRSARTEQLQPGSRKLFELSRLVREVASDAQFEASGSDRRVLVLRSEAGLVCGDRELLRSAVENVIRNAIRYTPGKTDVTIVLKKAEGAHARLTVRDRGPGVPQDALPHLFEPFYRVNDARDRDSGGAGLGLAITRHVVSAHGGTVRAFNRDGGGFEVQIDLPLTIPESTGRNGIKFRAS